MRSEKYPAHYEIGRLNGRPLYWSPATGYSVEEDGEYLVKVSDITDAKLFTEYDMWRRLERAIRESHGRLREAMDAALRAEVESIEEDMRWAERCEAEKEATLRRGSGVYDAS